MIDEKGRCCGRKPLVYKRDKPHRFCPRCDKAYNIDNDDQIENWAWEMLKNGFFVKRSPS